MRMRELLLIALASTVAPAQMQIQGPRSGWIFDGQTNTLRPIEGFPGAARLGVAISLPFQIRMALFDANQQTAVGVRADNGEVMTIRPQEAPGVASSLPLTPDPDLLTLDAKGIIVATYYRRTATLEILHAGERAILDWPVGAGQVTVIATAANGTGLLVGSDRGVFLVAGLASPRLLAPATHVSAIVVEPTSGQVVFADDAANEVWMLPSIDGGARRLADAAGGLAGPVGLAMTHDDRLWIVNRDSRRLVQLSLTSGAAMAALDLPGPAAGCTAIGDTGLVQLASPAPGPIQFLDQTGTPWIFFVPVD